MRTFTETMWRRVKVGDIALVCHSGRIVPAEIRTIAIAGDAARITYRFEKGGEVHARRLDANIPAYVETKTPLRTASGH